MQIIKLHVIVSNKSTVKDITEEERGLKVAKVDCVLYEQSHVTLSMTKICCKEKSNIKSVDYVAFISNSLGY